MDHGPEHGNRPECQYGPGHWRHLHIWPLCFLGRSVCVGLDADNTVEPPKKDPSGKNISACNGYFSAVSQ